MDISTIVGFLLAAGMIFFAIKDGANNFIDTPSILIVVGGGVAATMMSIPMKIFSRIAGVAAAAFKERRNDPLALIESLVKFSEIARRDGILALESALEGIDDPFLSKGIQMAVDGSDPDVIYETLTQELEQLQARHESYRSIFELMGKYAPAYGMIGTLVGLILMLAQLDDPSKIAPNMAVALITTLYGALLANVFCIPLADKLAKKDKEESQTMEIIINGVMAIQSGDSPRVVEQKLKIYLPPKLRDKEVR